MALIVIVEQYKEVFLIYGSLCKGFVCFFTKSQFIEGRFAPMA